MGKKTNRSFPAAGGLTSRREVLRRGAAIAAVTIVAPTLPRFARAQSATTTFDYYISTTGADSNPGTVAQPWAITSLQANNPNNAKMAGKRIGLIAGRYTLNGMRSGSNPGNYAYSILSPPPGSSSAPTVIASSDTSGHYSPRVATIAWGSTAALVEGLIGPEQNCSTGYITIDGLVIDGTNTNGGHLVQAFSTVGAAGSYQADSVTAPVGLVVQNCEICNIIATDVGNNDAGVFWNGANGAIVQNCYFHDISKPSQADHCHAYEEYGSRNCQFIYNTVVRCSASIESKGGCSGTVVAYNYVTASQCIALLGFDGATGYPNNPSTSYYIHHNIFDGCHGSDAPTPLINCDQANNYTLWQDIAVYNNTVYDSASGSYQAWHLPQDKSSVGTTTFHDNLTVLNATGNGGGLHPGNAVNLTSGKFAGLDHNGYGVSALALGLDGGTYSTLASWQAATGGDAHAVVEAAAFASAIVSGNGPAQFQLSAGSAHLGAGTGGANIGAWDGKVTQIGCNFAPGAVASAPPVDPNAPVLSVS